MIRARRWTVRARILAMSVVAPTVEDMETNPVAEWRRLSRFLWTGRRDGRPIGTIEHGRRFVLLGLDGDPLGRFRTLAEAQAAA